MTEDISFLCNSNSIVEKVIKSTYAVRPVCIIIYGPPGSGKSSIFSKIISHKNYLTSFWDFNIDIKTKPRDYCWESMDMISLSESKCDHINPYNYNLIPILHDEILSSIPSYKPYQINFIEKLNKIDSHNISDYESISKEYYEVYNKYKEYVYLVTSRLIDSCLSNRRNILIETTGNSIVYIEETIKKIKGNGYYVVCIYPFLELSIIYKRIIERSKVCGRIIDKKTVDTCYINALDNFFNLSNKCDESMIVNPEITFNKKSVIYYKRYLNYKVNLLINNKLEELYRYYIHLFDYKIYHASIKHLLSRLNYEMKKREVLKSDSE